MKEPKFIRFWRKLNESNAAIGAPEATMGQVWRLYRALHL